MIDAQRIRKELQELDAPSYHLKQIEQWYWQGVITFAQMTDLPRGVREELHKRMQPCSLTLARRLDSNDRQTSKFVLQLHDATTIETVLMRHRTGRNTICISSQVGCPLQCQFCATGRMGYRRDLTPAEIVDQVVFARSVLRHERTVNEGLNVVFMGMGEPLLNFESVLSAVEILSNKMHIGGRRVTISTVGIIPGIEQLARANLQINLAISLHFPYDDLRQRYIPIAKRYPLKQLLKTAEYYMELTNKKIFWEYALLRDINDHPRDASALVALLPKKLSHINLIRWNQIPGTDLKPSTPAAIKQFHDNVESKGFAVTIRHPMGSDIQAACGQLAGGTA
jgi:23S rRNA (adenine2503-C2)-methyltransferase